MTQRRKSKKTEAEPRRVNRRTFLAGAGAAACVGAGLWLRRKKFSKQDKTKAEKQSVENPALPAGEWRAVWVSYLEWAAMDFSSADAFRAGCVQMLENCAGLGLNTVLAQVRPFGDALYKSQLFPWSHLCTGVQGQDPGFDPLDVLLLCSEPILPMTLVRSYPIGVMTMEDGGMGDEKIIAIPYGDPTYMSYTDVSELPKHIFEELMHFFSVYKQLERGKQTEVKDIGGPMAAVAVMEKAMENYRKKFGTAEA